MARRASPRHHRHQQRQQPEDLRLLHHHRQQTKSHRKTKSRVPPSLRVPKSANPRLFLREQILLRIHPRIHSRIHLRIPLSLPWKRFLPYQRAIPRLHCRVAPTLQKRHLRYRQGCPRGNHQRIIWEAGEDPMNPPFLITPPFPPSRPSHSRASTLLQVKAEEFSLLL